MKIYDYTKLAKIYDLIELETNTPKYQNKFLKKFFTENNINKVLDITCGTGAQTVFLKSEGFNVEANDINPKMLEVAKEKAKNAGHDIAFHNHDMRNAKIGKFEAVISLFNSIGHLDKKNFHVALQNIRDNLEENGYFIFDIYNLHILKIGGHIPHEFIDTCITADNKKLVRFSHSKLNTKKGILKIRQKILYQEDSCKPQKHINNWEMQIYTWQQINEILGSNGFKAIKFYNRNAGEFSEDKSWSVLTVAQKQ